MIIRINSRPLPAHLSATLTDTSARKNTRGYVGLRTVPGASTGVASPVHQPADASCDGLHRPFPSSTPRAHSAQPAVCILHSRCNTSGTISITTRPHAVTPDAHDSLRKSNTGIPGSQRPARPRLLLPYTLRNTV